ncbi:hypothetical protein Rhopal_001887-T1 [Rhodotorula paludigena]|uniref:DNA repair protein rad9 n=1 Tax=Rhodotorula paludigena TaxID=86838 RepID=A0AAV5GHC2_9BASI|nr:hypothetical protein Rhopal_001887-T1 [Rhodotorula paludigena]
MELNIAGGTALKNFTRAVACLTKIGDDLDFSCAPTRLSISTVNSSRTAFGIVHLYTRFFAEYRLVDPESERPYKFSITGKPFLSTLRSKSQNTVESCSISVVDSDAPGHPHEPGVDSGECRLVVHMFCQHGVRKKHSLTYSDPNVQNWARFDLNACTSTWTASSRVLKEWTDHFHVRPGASGGSDEITFYCGGLACRLKSFNDTTFDETVNSADHFASRPLATELIVDIEDFDAYDVPEEEVVTFALKEFKAIITLADSLPTPLSAHFTSGGRPLMLALTGDAFEAKFVVATTDYDSGGGAPARDNKVKREKSESVQARAAGSGARTSATPAQRTGAGAAASGAGGQRPLFNAPTPSPAPASFARGGTQPAAAGDSDDDEYGGGMDDLLFDDPDEAFAEIDRLSQLPPPTQQRQEDARVLVSETTQGAATQLGPTQGAPSGGASKGGTASQEGEAEDERSAKRARWNLLGDG